MKKAQNRFAVQRGSFAPAILLLIAIVGAIVFIGYRNIKLNDSIQELKTGILNLNNRKEIATSSPIPVITNIPQPTNIPTATPEPKSFEEEERLMRKTLAGFEMYIGTSNTAGALSFFTPPQTDQAKEKYDNIQSKNLPYTLKSWSMVQDSNYVLAVENIKNGYRVRMIECRSNSDTCPLLFIELVRTDYSENGFSVDRYYTSEYMYQNNLGEEIKYQGFGF